MASLRIKSIKSESYLYLKCGNLDLCPLTPAIKQDEALIWSPSAPSSIEKAQLPWLMMPEQASRDCVRV